jgi:N-dimethylarginine dimethylaminohydrolase
MEVAAGAIRGMNETDPLTRVVMKHARDAFVSTSAIGDQWRSLNYGAPPDLAAAIDEYDRFVEIIRSAGTDIMFLPPDQRVGLDSIYVRDASIVTPAGVIVARMGKAARATEPATQADAFTALGLPVAGSIQPPGTLEGGDLLWLDGRTVAVGEGYRTNAEGIRQLPELLGPDIEVVAVPLPHWRGPGDVLHLMSLISPVDRNLAVVYSPLMAVPFRRMLLDRGYTLVEVPEAEFDSMAGNVLALGPRRCLMVAGNPRTRAALERAGAEVVEYEGAEISAKGAGGPTCLTRPIARDPEAAPR